MKKINLLIFTFIFTFSLFAQIKSEKTNIYRRSSIYSLMLDDVRFGLKVSSTNTEMVKDIFINAPVPDKFNNHNLTEKIIPATISSIDRSKNALRQVDKELIDINNFFETNQTAKKLVEKWFNRNKNGSFNTSIIEERGFYDATQMDLDIANNSARGLAILSDAGEELISNTFVIVNTFEYFQISSATGGTNNPLLGQGYQVFIKTYLFQLDWNKDVEQTFYKDYWCNDKTVTQEKAKLFDESNLFRLKYLGFDFKMAQNRESSGHSNLSRIGYIAIGHEMGKGKKITNENLIESSTIKTMDEVLVLLQKKFDAFKTKSPMNSVNPITAKIGLKEGITEKSKFDVIEQEIDENGKTKYTVVGVVAVDNKQPIWDNRYGVINDLNNQNCTYFKKISGGEFYPGMLIIQKKGT